MLENNDNLPCWEFPLWLGNKMCFDWSDWKQIVGKKWGGKRHTYLGEVTLPVWKLAGSRFEKNNYERIDRKHTQTSGVPGPLWRINGLTATVIRKPNWGGGTYEQNGLSHPSVSVLQTLLQLRTTLRARASYYQSPGADAASRRVVN